MADIDRFGKISEPFDFVDKSDIIRSLYNVKHTELRMYCSEHLVEELRKILSTI